MPLGSVIFFLFLTMSAVGYVTVHCITSAADKICDE
jgi:hypothetical protein